MFQRVVSPNLILAFAALTLRSRWRSFAPLTIIWLIIEAGSAASPWVLEVDFSKTNGVIRPLHGVNKGPLVAGGLIDLTEQHRDLGIPFNRLHDCHWPNPDVVDIHAIFPDFNADPAEPASYEFAATDEYIAAIRATGAQVIYRLGESIEHTKVKRFVHPPKDPEKWAAICLGIIRHYNEGWAHGFHHDIRYWEIWNEPENRPAMWTGSDDEFLTLYATAARAIKSRFPRLKIGGPGFGHSGQLADGELKPSEFVLKFLDLCRRESMPLDFFSWHCYTDNPAELVQRAKGIRRLLDAKGFATTESHLNEWNYLPGNSWKALSKGNAGEERQKFYDDMSGASGAAFILSALLELQDAPVDVCNLFHGEVGGFGLFNENGVPLKSYHALRAFRALQEMPHRAEARGAVPGRLAIAAGLSPAGSEAVVAISNFRHRASNFVLKCRGFPWLGQTIYEIRLLDDRTSFEPVARGALSSAGELTFLLEPSAIAVITIRSAAGRRGDRSQEHP